MYLNRLLLNMDRGEKLKVGEAKTAILLHILENKDSVSEPEIRKHLLEKLGMKNQGTINEHLHKLADLKCIESVTPTTKSRSNFWDITKLTHLKNIRLEFPNIRVNSKEKSIMIIFNERGYSLDKIENLSFYIKLFLSISLFDAFLDADINELMYKSEKIYLKGEGYIKTKNYEYYINKFFKLYEKVNPEYKLPNDFNIYKRNISKEAFLKVFEESFQGITEEMINELDEAYNKLKELNDDMMYKPVQILLNHFINHDIYKDLESPDENVYFKNLKECIRKADEIWKKEGYPEIKRWSELLHLQELEVYSEIIKKYKQPSIFYISEDPQKIQSFLEDFYKDQIL